MRTTLPIVIGVLLLYVSLANAGTEAEKFVVTGQISFPASGPLVVALITEPEFRARALDPENPFVLTLALEDRHQRRRQISFTFRHVPPGRYSVGCFQDVNGNAQFDLNLFGIPKEPWGVYRLRRSLFGSPEFDEVSFSIPTDMPHIQLDIH